MIPKHFFFTYGFAPEPEPFGPMHYLAVASALGVNPGWLAIFLYARELSGPWWDRTTALPGVRHQFYEPPREVHGRPLEHYAHQADVARLEMLVRYGGCYLDVDTLCLKSFGDLLDAKFVMGVQQGRGLCNAVMLSERDSAFGKAWQGEYASFRGKGRNVYWDEHSVQVPARIAQKMTDDIRILPHDRFFYPLWGHMDVLMESADYSPFARSYCVHLWESITRDRWLKRIDDEKWRAESSSVYASEARRWL